MILHLCRTDVDPVEQSVIPDSQAPFTAGQLAAGFLLGPGHRDLYSAILIFVPAISRTSCTKTPVEIMVNQYVMLTLNVKEIKLCIVSVL